MIYSFSVLILTYLFKDRSSRLRLGMEMGHAFRKPNGEATSRVNVILLWKDQHPQKPKPQDPALNHN